MTKELNDDRERIAEILQLRHPGNMYSTCERDADVILAAGFSRAAVPDAATELQSRADAELLRMMRNNFKHAEAERDAAQAAAKLSHGFLGIEKEEHEETRAERDAALAAVERVRAIHRNAGPSQGYDSRFKGSYGMLGDCCAECGSHGEYGVEWPCPTLMALDGAPEPEDKPCNAEVHSWDHYRPEQIDSYWIRCTLLGKHDEHEDSHTGLKWRSGLPVEGESKP